MAVNCLSDYKICNLNEVVWFQEGPGVRKNQFRTSGVKLLNVGNICDRELIIDKTSIYISEEEAYGKYKHFLVDEGDLLIASSGIKVEYFDKKITFAKKEHLPLCMNTSTIRFKVIDKNVLDINYFRHFLASRYFTKQVQFYITGSAQLNFGPSHLNKMKIIVPPIDKQRKIAKILDKADEIRQKKKLTNDKLDEFLNSKFFEIFGNPESNPHGWNVEKLENITNKITDGVHSKPNYTDNGIPFISVKDITTKKLLFNDCKFISKEAHTDYCKRCKPEYEDILYTKVGATYGRACVVDTDKEFSLYVSVALIKPKRDIINPYFLKAVLNTDSVKKQADKRIKGIGVPDLHLVEIKSFLVPVPPMPEQIKFLRIVEKIEAQKQKNELVIEQMNNLFNSLSQKVNRMRILL